MIGFHTNFFVDNITEINFHIQTGLSRLYLF